MSLVRVDLLGDFGSAEAFVSSHEDDQADGQTDAGGSEGGVPSVLVPHDRSYEVADEGAQVDAEVEDSEPCVLQLAVLRVESAEHRRDVRFEEAIPDDQQRQSEVEHAHAFEGQADVSGAHDDAAEHDRLAVAEDPISDETADEGREINHGRVRAKDRPSLRFVESQSTLVDRRRHVERQQAEHEVEAEPFPHLREEQPGELARVPFGARAASEVSCHFLSIPPVVRVPYFLPRRGGE